jgi:exonuclease VII large subunit
MKKLFYSLFVLAMTAITFTSCEDVPAPYDDPNNNQGGGGKTVVDPTGQGTQDDPFNVIAAINYAKTLEVGAESPQVYIKGIVVSIAENYTTQYGNARFYISDDGTAKNQFLIYRALYLGNKKYTEGDILAEGDSVIICGVITNYNGTLETQQNKAFLYSLNGKSEGGGGGASGEAKGSGTLEDPYNPAGVIAYINSLGADKESPNDVYIKGKVGSITEQYGTQYGNATFTIVEEGAEGSPFTVFRALYLGNKKYSSGDLLKEGDEVIVCGKVVNYRGNTPETVQGQAFLYSLNGKSDGGGGGGTPGEAKGDGTLNNPYNPAGVIAYINSLGADNESPKDVYIKGNVGSITEQYGTQYGNATFTVVEKGAEGTEFTIYRALYLGNQKYSSGDLLKEGDEVIVCGRVVNYRGNTPETAQGKAYLYSLNGKTGDGGGGGTSGDAKGDGTLNNPFNAVAANNYASSLAADAKSDKEVYIKGKISKIANNGEFGTQYGNASFYISDDGTTNNEFYVFRTLYLGNKKYDNTSDPNIKVGDEVIIYGKVTNYRGNTPETVQNESYIYSLNGKTDGSGGGGGDTPQGTGTYDNPLTVAQAVALGEAAEAYVKGFIVGYVEGQVLSSGAKFEAGGSVNTNILIAASASEKDVNNCMPVQLSRDYRSDFALDANSDMLGKGVIIKGQLTKYFGVTGIKSPTYMEANGKSVGNKVKYRKRR